MTIIHEEDLLWVIDEILWLLKDGKWHSSEEIATKTSIHKFTVQMIIGFLSSYNFIEFDRKDRKVKLHPSTFEFVNEIQRVEEEDMRVLSSR